MGENNWHNDNDCACLRLFKDSFAVEKNQKKWENLMDSKLGQECSEKNLIILLSSVTTELYVAELGIRVAVESESRGIWNHFDSCRPACCQSSMMMLVPGCGVVKSADNNDLMTMAMMLTLGLLCCLSHCSNHHRHRHHASTWLSSSSCIISSIIISATACDECIDGEFHWIWKGRDVMTISSQFERKQFF